MFFISTNCCPFTRFKMFDDYLSSLCIYIRDCEPLLYNILGVPKRFNTHTHSFFLFSYFCGHQRMWQRCALGICCSQIVRELRCCCCFICCTHPKQTVTWLVNKKKTGEERKEKWQWPPTLLRSLLLLDGMGYVRQCERKSLSLFASPSWCFFLSLFSSCYYF